MSTKIYPDVQKIFDALVLHWHLGGYPALAEYVGVPYQTLMAWKKRKRIADYAPFMDKGISKRWLDTLEGGMLTVKETESSVHDHDPQGMVPDPTRMTLEQKLKFCGLSVKDIRQFQEWAKLSEAEQDDLLRDLTMKNLQEKRY